MPTLKDFNSQRHCKHRLGKVGRQSLGDSSSTTSMATGASSAVAIQGSGIHEPSYYALSGKKKRAIGKALMVKEIQALRSQVVTLQTQCGLLQEVIESLQLQCGLLPGHASPVQLPPSLVTATAGHASPALFDLFTDDDDSSVSSGHASPERLDAATQTDQLHRGHSVDG
eukprot:12226067-Karenia_brevis.AAC.1